MHRRGGEIFAGQVRNPVTEIVIMRRDEASPVTVNGVANIIVGVAAVTSLGEVRGL